MERRLKRQQQVLLLPLLPLLPLRSLPSTPLSGRRSTHVETPPRLSTLPVCVCGERTYIYACKGQSVSTRFNLVPSNKTIEGGQGVLLADDGVMAPLASQLADRLCQSVSEHEAQGTKQSINQAINQEAESKCWL